LRAVVVLTLLAGCTAPGPAHVPADVLPYDAGFVASSHRLRVTLARDSIQLDTTPVLRTCDVPRESPDCARCEVATVLDKIDPELVDRMAIAFARYPTSMRKAARLEHVAFCSTIHYEGSDHGPAGLADPSEHRVFIGVEYFRGSSFAIESAVHHEMFHLLDFEIDASRALDDREWRELNPKGFAYRDPSVETERKPGFVSSYALTNAIEDRASTFEFLMVKPDELCALAARDPVLLRKVRLLWQRVARIEGADRLGITAPCVLSPKQRKRKTQSRPRNSHT
jgi:hypothetical protein